MTKVFCASDHGGFDLKTDLLKHYPEWIDLGCKSNASTDYPTYANILVDSLRKDAAARGILICGTGIGMSIAANRHKGIRAMVGNDKTFVKLSRQHNNTNVLCLPGRFMDLSTACELIDIFLKTPFEGGRHIKRIDALDT